MFNGPSNGITRTVDLWAFLCNYRLPTFLPVEIKQAIGFMLSIIVSYSSWEPLIDDLDWVNSDIQTKTDPLGAKRKPCLPLEYSVFVFALFQLFPDFSPVSLTATLPDLWSRLNDNLYCFKVVMLWIL